MKQSNFLSLNWRDLSRSALLAVLTALYYWIQETLLPGLNLSPEIKTLISGGLAYLTKNLFTKPDKIVGDRPGDRG